MLRVCSALVLVPIAIGTAYLGGWPFAVFWGLAAMGVLWEWISLVARSDHRTVLMTGGASLALAVALVATGHLLAAVIVLAISTLGVAALAPAKWRTWIAAGVPYAGALGVAPVVLRSDSADGFLAVIFLFAIVWTTDVVAYFSGRAIGGPKLMAQVSPKKTWSGAIGGTLAAVIVAFVLAKVMALSGLFAIAMLAVVLSICAQGGDLFEIFPQAPIWRQGFRPSDSWPRRADGSPRRLHHGQRGGRADRIAARRVRGAGPRSAGVVN